MPNSVITSQDFSAERLAGRYLTFTLDGDNYGIPVMSVKEIIHMSPITPVRRMPKYVKGIINLRGAVIPVIDMRLKFSMPPEEYDDRTCVIVVTVSGEAGERDILMGAIVDTVEEVLLLTAEEIEPTPEFGIPADTQYMLGVSTAHGCVKTLLNIEKIFREEGIVDLLAVDPYPKQATHNQD